MFEGPNGSRSKRPHGFDALRHLALSAATLPRQHAIEVSLHTKALVDRAGNPDAEAFETDISKSIEALGDQIRQAGKAVGVAPEKKRTAALDRARELANGLDSLKERLRARGTTPSSSSPQAAALVERLQGLATERNFKDPLGLAELTGQVSEDIKLLEYALRREAEGDRPTLQLSGSEDLPPGYRAMVEEYYRTLARKPKK